MGSKVDSYDVFVVGCGIAGLSAAVSAQQAGARVALLERAPKEERDGNTRYTESFWRMQSHDAVSEDFWDRFAENAGGHLDPAVIEESVKPYDEWPRLLRGLGFVDPELVTTLAGQCRADAALAHRLRGRVRLSAQLLHHREHDAHGRQLDGMGGGISSLSKVVVVSPSARPGVDVDYLFGQVAVDRALVDCRSNCGNLTAAVGPFAVDEGLVEVADGEARLILHNCNLDQRIRGALRGRRRSRGGRGRYRARRRRRPWRTHPPFLPGPGRCRHRPPATDGPRARRTRCSGFGLHRGHADRRVDGARRRSRRCPGCLGSRTTGCNRGRLRPQRPAGGDPSRRRRHGDRAGNRERAQGRLRRPARRRGDDQRRGGRGRGGRSLGPRNLHGPPAPGVAADRGAGTGGGRAHSRHRHRRGRPPRRG